MSQIKNNINIEELIINVEKIGEDFFCTICCDLIYRKEMLQCIHGHLFCRNCWEDALKRKKECIICRVPIMSIQTLSRNRVVENLFLKKNKAQCLYSFIQGGDFNKKMIDQNGCKDIISLENYENHIATCLFKIIDCDNSKYGCKETFRRSSLASHLQVCRFRMVKCQLCNKQVSINSIEMHGDECLEKPIKCVQNCDLMDVKRSEMQHHIDKECPNSIIACKYKDGGCDKVLKRSELYSHFQQDNHFNVMARIIERNTNQLNALIQLVGEISNRSLTLFSGTENKDRNIHTFIDTLVIENYTQRINELFNNSSVNQTGTGNFLKLKSSKLNLGPFQVYVTCSANKATNQIILEYEENSFIKDHCQFSFSLNNSKNFYFCNKISFKDNKASFELDRVNFADGWISNANSFKINFYLNYIIHIK